MPEIEVVVSIPRYKKADEHIIFNDNDPQLAPISYKLPEPPPVETIAGYGLMPQDQYFDALAPKVPLLLKALLKEPISNSQRVKRIDNNPEFYQEVADYIEAEWDRVINGFWFYNNGRPTYITGCNYFYVRYWYIEDKLPDFRLRDREFWLFVKMCEDDPYCYGFNYPKHRREGATTKICCWRYYYAMMTPHARVGLQSKNKTHAEEVHQVQMIEPWKMLPFYFSPVWDNNRMNTSEIRFYAPEGQKHEDFGKQDLKSLIDFMDSGEKAYDGLKRQRLHNDEIGKTEEVDVGERWDTQKLCLVDGTTIIGKAANTSTVDEMEFKGGAEFKAICDKSHHTLPKGAPENILKRNENGETVSGLYNLFIPACEGLKIEDKKTGRSSINKFGETDTNWTMNWIKNTRAGLKAAGDTAKYVTFLRIFPLQWGDCWRIAAKDCAFNAQIIDDRLDWFNENGNPYKRRGRFKWKDGIQDTRVIWVDDPAGPFFLSYIFPNEETDSNRFEINHLGFRCPVNKDFFIAGGDPYKYKPKKGSRGGGAVFMKRDPRIDPDNRPVKDWETHRFCCTYSFRPRNQYVYLEDMLMMCIYFSCQIFAETNVDAIPKHFIERGYSQYLFHYWGKDGAIKEDAGSDTGVKLKENIFAQYDTYIELHGERECHDELLIECRVIADDMGPFDRFVAGGFALLGNTKNPFAIPVINDEATLDNWFATYKAPIA